jgi:hypothetical protein
MTHESAEVRTAAFGQAGGYATLRLSTRQLDLDEFVIRERLIEGCDHCIADTRLTDGDDGLLAVGQLA